MTRIYSHARKGEITKPEADRFFDCADTALAMLKSPIANTEPSPMEEEIEKMSNQITMVLAIQSPLVSLGDDIDKLATLRKNGMISEDEFQAFSERFKLSTGQKAQEIITAISELYEQRLHGAMSEGNYHAALWSLLDKLDRKT
jgi:hypothetical protein